VAPGFHLRRRKQKTASGLAVSLKAALIQRLPTAWDVPGVKGAKRLKKEVAA
jgi:hypothetical protein